MSDAAHAHDVRIAILAFLAVALAGGGATTVFKLSAAEPDTGSSGHMDRLPPLESAGPFLLAEIYAKEAGEWEHAWSTLYPPEQRLVPEALYVSCERATPFTVPFESARVVRVRAALVRVPELPAPLRGAAVTVSAKFAVGYGPRDPLTITHTFHIVPADGVWKWLLSPSRYAMYSRGRCDATSSSSTGLAPRTTAAVSRAWSSVVRTISFARA